MTTLAMRNQLISYLTDADDEKIVGLYSLLEGAIEDSRATPFSEDELNFLSEERKKHLSGESKSYSWGEVKGIIQNKKAS